MKRRTQITMSWPFGLPDRLPSVTHPVTSIGSEELRLSGLVIKTVDDGRIKGYRNRLYLKFTSIKSRVPDIHRTEIERRLHHLATQTVIGSQLSSGSTATYGMDGKETQEDQGTISFEHIFHLKEGENFCEGALRVGHAVLKTFTMPSEWETFPMFSVEQISWVKYKGVWMTYTEYLREQAKERFHFSSGLASKTR